MNPPLGSTLERVRSTVQEIDRIVTQIKAGFANFNAHVEELQRQADGFRHLRDEVHKIDECGEQECEICSVLHCPNLEAMHFHHDGCPACDMPETDRVRT